MDVPVISRRGAIAAMSGIALGAVTTGCTTRPRNPGPVEAGEGLLPNYVAFDGLEPDLPSSAEGIPSAFFEYPAEPATYADVPLSLSAPVTVLTPTNGIGTPRANSPWGQNLQNTLGLELQMNLVAGADLSTKQQAMLAGGDIPDIAIVNPNNVPLAALDKYFADLGPFLSGAAVEKYRGLAAIPSLAWRTPTINGRLFGIPQPRISASYTLAIRQDLLGGGAPIELTRGDDLLTLFEEMTDERRSRWAFGQDLEWLLRLVLEMHGVPNGVNAWQQQDGAFTSMYEAPQMKDALQFVADVFKAGHVHPDAVGNPNAAWFPGGTTLSLVNDFATYATMVAANPDMDIELLPAPQWDGGGLAVKQLNAGASGNYAALRKADDDRIVELLEFANYLAAPVGTAEFLVARYGKEGESFEWQNGNPVLTGAGRADVFNAEALGYVTSGSMYTLYTPGHADFTRKQHDFLTTVMKQTHFNPAIGLYSATLVSGEASTANGRLGDVMDDIMQGRADVASWDKEVTTWRDTVGNRIREELQDAFAQSK